MKDEILEIIDTRVGLIHSLNAVDFKNMSESFYRYMVLINHNFCNKKFPGTGFSLNKESAKIKAIGEALERYCSVIQNPEKIRYCVESNLELDAISPINFNRYTTNQYNNSLLYNDYDPSTKRKWVEATHKNSGRTVFLPFETIYLLIPNTHLPFRDVVSTGLACGPTVDFAFENGLNECIERDAFMLFWLLGEINYEIDLTSIKNKELNKLVSIANNQNINIRLFDISQNEFKTFSILCFLKIRDNKGFYMATSTNKSLLKALKGAVEEGISGYTAFRERIAFYELIPPNSPEEINSLEDHASFYVNGHYDEILNKVIPSSTKKIPINETIKYSYLEMMDSVLSSINVYYHDLTSIDVKSIGLTVMRVVTPDLLFLPYGTEPLLESNRLKEKLKNKKSKSINMMPHPFP